MRWGVS